MEAITVTAFNEWLSRQNGWFMYSSSGNCAFARFLQDRGYTEAEVGTQNYYPYGYDQRFMHRYPIPGDLAGKLSLASLIMGTVPVSIWLIALIAAGIGGGWGAAVLTFVTVPLALMAALAFPIPFALLRRLCGVSRANRDVSRPEEYYSAI